MRPVAGITDLELGGVIQYLAGAGARGGGAGRGSNPNAVYPAGPVVERGGVTTPALPVRSGPTFGGQGPTGGNVAYPSDVVDALAYDMQLRADPSASSRAVDAGQANGISLRQPCEYRHPRKSVALAGGPLHPGACQIQAR